MKTEHDVCIVCRGTGSISPEHMCEECEGWGYIRRPEEAIKRLKKANKKERRK